MAQPATPEEQAAAQRRRRAAAVAVAGGAALTLTGHEHEGDAPAMAPAPARAAAAAAILAGLVSFLADQRQRAQAFLRAELSRRAPAQAVAVDVGGDVRLSPIERIIAEEDEREQEFTKRSAQRFARDVTSALAIPDRARREGAVQGLVARERRYAQQRAEAMAARAFAAVDRVVLRGQSPTGAFWKLDPNVMEHTAGCLIMGGKFWPWEVLDRVHPPRHYGCPCRLLSYGEAVAKGLLVPGAVRDARAAVRAAAHVVMEGALVLDTVDAEALIEAAGGREAVELRGALLAGGLVVNEQALDALLDAAG